MLDNFANLNIQSNPNEIVKDTVYTLYNNSLISINMGDDFTIDSGSEFLIIDTGLNKVGNETDAFQEKWEEGIIDPYLDSGDLIFRINGVDKTKYECIEFYNQYLPAYEKGQLVENLYYKESNIDAGLLKKNGVTLDNEVVINSKSDLPNPVDGVITLSDNDLVYRMSSIINLGTDRIVVTGSGIVFHGNNTSSSGIMTMTTGVAITCTNTFSVQNMAIIAPSSSKIIEATGSNTEVLYLSESIFVGATQQIDCTDYDVFITRFCRYLNGGNAILFSGTFTNILVDKNIFRGVLLNLVNFNGCNVHSVSINVNTPVLEATSTFLTIGADSSNIINGGEGTITGNKVDDTLGGISIVGYSPFDIKWEVSGNNTILISDRLQPTGWGAYFDSNASTQIFNDTPSLLTIDGLGASTNETRLPKSIRGTGNLWSGNEICPITEGDSGNIRIFMNTIELVSNPTRIDFILDISGNATPDIPVYSTSLTLKADDTQPLGVVIPFYVLTTFIANKGQIFMSVNSGTVEVTDKQIFIQRTSSGAL